MVEQWIGTSTARDLVGDTFAICARLHADLLQARARRLIVNGNPVDNIDVPNTFWWAQGHEALTQNWATGDFSTWIDDREHVEAFGVTLALSGVLAMLPIERRAPAAFGLSVASNTDWVSAKEARRLCYERGGENPAIAGRMLLAQAKLGFVTARAVVAKGKKSTIHGDRWAWEEREWDVETWFWERFTDSHASSQGWEIGLFTGRGNGPNGLAHVELTGLHFHSASLELLFPAKHATPNAATVPKNVGGRLPAAFADDLMCQIWALLFQGDFKPTRSADIQRAMQDWASENGHLLGDTVAKEKARKVFAAYSVWVGNPS
jgi:hypothetical protein